VQLESGALGEQYFVGDAHLNIVGSTSLNSLGSTCLNSVGGGGSRLLVVGAAFGEPTGNCSTACTSISRFLQLPEVPIISTGQLTTKPLVNYTKSIIMTGDDYIKAMEEKAARKVLVEKEKEFVRCSAIEGISHRYHRCGPVCMLEVKDKCRGSSLQMAFRIFRCHKAFKTNEGSLDTSFGDLKPT
jgi:hypothetical protein